MFLERFFGTEHRRRIPPPDIYATVENTFNYLSSGRTLPSGDIPELFYWPLFTQVQDVASVYGLPDDHVCSLTLLHTDKGLMAVRSMFNRRFDEIVLDKKLIGPNGKLCDASRIHPAKFYKDPSSYYRAQLYINRWSERNKPLIVGGVMCHQYRPDITQGFEIMEFAETASEYATGDLKYSVSVFGMDPDHEFTTQRQ